MIAGGNRTNSDLLNEVALEGDVLAGGVRECHGNDVGQSLGLMDDGISVGQVLPVICPDLPTPYRAAQLLMDLVWKIHQTCSDI